MFKPAPMEHVNIFVIEDDVLKVTVALGQLGVLHLAEPEGSEAWARDESDRWSEQAEQYEDLERQFREILDGLGISRLEAPPLDHVEPWGDAERAQQALDEVKETLQDWEERRDAVEDELERLHLLQEGVRALKPLDVPVEKLQALNHLHLVAGSLPKEDLDRLHMVLFSIPFVVIPIYERDDWVFVFAASAEEDAAVLDRALESALFDRLELPEGVTGLPENVLEELESRVQEAESQLQSLEEEREQRVADYGERLLERWRQSQYNASVMRTISRFGRHEEAYLITGWVPEEDLDELVATVDETAEHKADVQVLEAAPEKRRQTPTLLENPGILRPFQRILSIFGFPAYDQVDPTPIVALTFVLMFGMMFGDVGHGLVLVLVGLWLARKEGMGIASLAPMMVAAGTSGMLFGLLYGSLFGREDILPHLWLSPLEEVMPLLMASVGAGVALLNLGFLLHVVSAWRSREWGSLFFSQNGVAGITLYWALLGGGLLIFQGNPLPTALWIPALVLPMLLILLREPLERVILGDRPLVEQGWVTYGVRSFFELFESVIGYFTNSVSFVRLGAFAVAHAALGRVVFIMADLASGPGRWLIILLGTLIIIGFEGMVVSIQALRLEYYEFFDKFFQGTGRPFQPFRLRQGEGAAVPEEA